MAKFAVYNFVSTDRDMMAKGGSFSFRSYTDRNGSLPNSFPGKVIIFDDGTKDKQGTPTGKSFTISQAHYNLQAREGQQDYNKLKMFDYFANSPWCEGSPNGDYIDVDGHIVSAEHTQDSKVNLRKIKTGEFIQKGVKFRLLDTEMDAEVVLDAGKKKAEAQLSAVELDDLTLQEIGALIGEYGDPGKKMRLKVYEYAGKKPIDYFAVLNSGDRVIRATIRKGLNDGVLKAKGPVIYWEDTLIGNDEDSAVSKLLSDTVMLEALQQKVNFKNESKKKKK